MNRSYVIRDSTAADFPELLRLNVESEHFLSPLSLERLRSLHSMAWHHRVICQGNSVHGFLFAFREGVDYDSPNYQLGMR
jgi:predicted GNAT superfamily acetyltransferase